MVGMPLYHMPPLHFSLLPTPAARCQHLWFFPVPHHFLWLVLPPPNLFIVKSWRGMDGIQCYDIPTPKLAWQAFCRQAGDRTGTEDRFGTDGQDRIGTGHFAFPTCSPHLCRRLFPTTPACLLPPPLLPLTFAFPHACRATCIPACPSCPTTTTHHHPTPHPMPHFTPHPTTSPTTLLPLHTPPHPHHHHTTPYLPFTHTLPASLLPPHTACLLPFLPLCPPPHTHFSRTRAPHTTHLYRFVSRWVPRTFSRFCFCARHAFWRTNKLRGVARRWRTQATLRFNNRLLHARTFLLLLCSLLLCYAAARQRQRARAVRGAHSNPPLPRILHHHRCIPTPSHLRVLRSRWWTT